MSWTDWLVLVKSPLATKLVTVVSMAYDCETSFDCSKTDQGAFGNFWSGNFPIPIIKDIQRLLEEIEPTDTKCDGADMMDAPIKNLAKAQTEDVTGAPTNARLLARSAV